ncbi:uncharacterized protein LOC118278633 [Spodoptera frugiperda]|uniref:Uncharacterized protein LOC118278633 n=1 Tax=Spodoptera frugiperda TaxID=7108 RepID=A0A9R0E6V4_SPOFR|nr:uncharacterized protein LOC118278633 [Spodoptera frugiperda]
MDNICVNAPAHKGVSSLETMYTDFDGWVTRFNSCYKRSPEIRTTSRQNNSRRHDDSDLYDRDYFLNDLLLRQRQLRRSARRPCFNFYKENDGFISYDHVYYRIMSQNGDKSVVYQYIRSKL